MQKTPVRRKSYNQHISRAYHTYQNVRTIFDLYNKLETLKRNLAEISENLSEKASDILSNSVKSAKNKTTYMQRNLRRFVTRKPYKSIGIVALACLCIVLIIRKK